MKLTRAKYGDIDSIIELHGELSPLAIQTGRKVSREFVKKNLKRAIANNEIFLFKDKQKVVGFCWVSKSLDHFGNEYSDIKVIVISPQYQNKGYGRKMVKHIEKYLCSTDIRLTVLNVNRARGLYRKLGYKPFAEVLRKVK